MTPPIPYKTVVGQFLGPDGSPIAGKLRFIPSTTVYNALGNVVVPPQPITVTLDGSGSFSVQLAVTDDTSTTPTGWVWQMSALIPDGAETTFQVPSSAPSTVSFAYLTPETFSVPQFSYMTTAQGVALVTRMTTVEDLTAVLLSAPVDAAANVGSLRTLGSGPLQAAAGNHTHSADALTGYGGDNYILTLMGAL